MPVIVGAPRSGTTLLRFMLDAHPDLAIPPETGFLGQASGFHPGNKKSRQELFQLVTNFPPNAPAWQDFGIPKQIFQTALEAIEPFDIADGFRTFYRLYAQRFQKQRWGDKTPAYCHQLREINALLPEAHFIHLIRDGRDVCLSLRQLWFSPGHDVATQARYWMEAVNTGRRQGAHCRHYLEVRYEQLVRHPHETLQKICDFIRLDFSESMLAYHRHTPARLTEHRARMDSQGKLIVSQEQRLRQQIKTTEPPDPNRVQAWKSAMPADERSRYEAIAGGLLRELGY